MGKCILKESTGCKMGSLEKTTSRGASAFLIPPTATVLQRYLDDKIHKHYQSAKQTQSVYF